MFSNDAVSKFFKEGMEFSKKVFLEFFHFSPFNIKYENSNDKDVCVIAKSLKIYPHLQNTLQ